MTENNYIKCWNEFSYGGRQFNSYTTASLLDEVCKFEFIPTDIITSTFPRCGTTLINEIIWHVKNHKEISKNEMLEDITLRFPFLEYNYEYDKEYEMSFINMLNLKRNNPFRLIKTHVPYDFIKENFEKVNPKMVVVMRNPKDCLVSNFYFYLKMRVHEWHGTFGDFFHLFLNGKTFTGSYFDNILEWWSLRNQKNVLILFYEDIVRNMAENVTKIAEFLNELLTVEELDIILHNCSFFTMSRNPNINVKIDDEFSFLRKGIIGDWKNHFSEEQNKLLDLKIEEEFRGSDLLFIYE